MQVRVWFCLFIKRMCYSHNTFTFKTYIRIHILCSVIYTFKMSQCQSCYIRSMCVFSIKTEYICVHSDDSKWLANWLVNMHIKYIIAPEIHICWCRHDLLLRVLLQQLLRSNVEWNAQRFCASYMSTTGIESSYFFQFEKTWRTTNGRKNVPSTL